jgi:hypothetical protein
MREYVPHLFRLVCVIDVGLNGHATGVVNDESGVLFPQPKCILESLERVAVNWDNRFNFFASDDPPGVHCEQQVATVNLPSGIVR